METTLYDKAGEAVAYIASDYNETIYLWDGSPVAYLYEARHVYGINGRHLGWWIEEILYDNYGERIGFTTHTCPVAISKEPTKVEKLAADEIRPRWRASPLPKLSFRFAGQALVDFLKDGLVARLFEGSLSKESQD